MKAWPHPIADTALARLTWELQSQYRFDLPPHLAVEDLAQLIGERYQLRPPVGFEAGCQFLFELGVLRG